MGRNLSGKAETMSTNVEKKTVKVNITEIVSVTTCADLTLPPGAGLCIDTVHGPVYLVSALLHTHMISPCLKKSYPLKEKTETGKIWNLHKKTGSRFMGVVGWMAGCDSSGVYDLCEREEWCFSRYYHRLITHTHTLHTLSLLFNHI